MTACPENNRMNNSRKFADKLRRGETCLGTAISLSDPVVAESLCPEFDFFWIDTEHTSVSLECLKLHLMAMKGADTTALVRVPWNDPVLIKPVPMVRSADEVARAVAACRYPPEGVRGFGPLRPLQYGRVDAQQYCDEANEWIQVIVQIEHVEAVQNIDQILSVPGLTSLAFGPQDLAASLGHRAQPRHPDVLDMMRSVIQKAQQAKVPVGVSVGDDPEFLCELADMGIQWLSMGLDVTLMIRAASEVAGKVRQHVLERGSAT
jgi:2-dehydro-3-deoxyglucarate aldolase/4-hydroxy-2-oxoheptanedioate aldolase